MSERLLDRDVGEDPRPEGDAGSAPSTPRWIGSLGIAVAILLIVALVVLHLIGAVGPGAH